MSENRFALIVASCQYEDPQLKQLFAPKEDANALARILGDPNIGCFQVKVLLNEKSYVASEAIEEFFENREREDLLLFYFSGHGVKSDDGKLYFAQVNTNKNKLRSTAISSDFINDLMKNSRSRRQIMILDCCFSGAFAKGMVPKSGVLTVGVNELFGGGTGRIVLTSSNSLQYSFEGQDLDIQAAATPARSVFTDLFVKGLESRDADLNKDGFVSPDELHQYILTQIKEKSAAQSPKIWKIEAEGEFFVARYPKPPSSIPGWVIEALQSTEFGARYAAVGELTKLVSDKDPGTGATARKILENIANTDMSAVIRGAASGALSDQLRTQSEKPPAKAAPKARIAKKEPVKTSLQPTTGSISTSLTPKPKIQKVQTQGKQAASAGQPLTQREKVKEMVRAFNQEDILICPYCSTQLKARSFIRHYDSQHPDSPATQISLKSDYSPPPVIKLKPIATLHPEFTLGRQPSEREKMKEFARAFGQEDMVLCPYCSVALKAKNFMRHYDDKHPSSPAKEITQKVAFWLPKTESKPITGTNARFSLGTESSERGKMKGFIGVFGQEDMVLCPYCSVALKAKSFMRHYDDKHPNAPAKKISPQQPPPWITTTSGKVFWKNPSVLKFKCSKCGKEFSSKELLEQHQKWGHLLIQK